MDEVVPSALQRLKPADIVRVAGLTAASLGQEYCRIGAVRATMRRGTQLLGIVDLTHVHDVTAESTANRVETTGQVPTGRCVVDVEILASPTWIAHCSCSPDSHAICSHAAALLYQWLARPAAFNALSPSSVDVYSAGRASQLARNKREASVIPPAGQKSLLQSVRQAGKTGHVVALRGPTPSGNLLDILTQNGLSELRGIAREYDIATIGLNKQQLAEAIADALKQPEAVRRAASTLEKPQRQLLATLALAGGTITDDDLQSLFERFSFGSPDKLQGMLLALQGKGLLFRASLNSGPQQRIGLSGSLFDIGWYVPLEVQAVLRVTVPITSFDVHKEIDDAGLPTLQQVEPYSLLADLLLVARVLDGYRLGQSDEQHERAAALRSAQALTPPRPPGALANDGTGVIAPPSGLASPALLETVQTAVPRAPLFLRYAVRLLRLADILHKDDTGTPYLRLLPNAARLLLGPTSAEVARDLFELWLTHPGYEELFDLQEEGLRLRCRTTPLNHPILRPGELEAENSEARQWLVAAVAQAPLNQWISFSAFARFIYRLNPTFLQKRQRLFPSPHWWLEQEEGRVLQPTLMSDWMRAEGHYLARLLRGPLHWWGINDLALSHDGRLLAFRLTPMAGLLLQGIELAGQASDHDDQDASSVSLEVLESGELLIPCNAAAWPFIDLIEEFAEVTGVRDNCLCYRLAPQALAEALGRGQHPTALLSVLQQIASDEPQNNRALLRLLAQLERWTASYGRVRLYTGVSLLEVADTLVLRELTATTSVEEQIVQTIAPTRMILKKPGTERIIEELKRRGQSPLLHEEERYGTE